MAGRHRPIEGQVEEYKAYRREYMRQYRAHGATQAQTRSVEERFWSFVAKSDGCWTWTGTTMRGYGQFKTTRLEQAHRVSWRMHFGPIPAGRSVCHSCDNPPCVRPDHLWLGTHAQNMRDMALKGRAASVGKNKTHCPQGHEYSLANTYIDKRNKRYCRTCQNARSRQRKGAA